MARIRGFWLALIPLCLFLTSALLQSACTCSSTRQPISHSLSPCIPQHAMVKRAAPLTSKSIVPGALAASFAVTNSGEVAIAMALAAVPSRDTPELTLSYQSGAGHGMVGTGFSLNVSSAITRCAKSMAIDGEVRAVQYDTADAWCIDTKRLVVTGGNDTVVEYRTFPDTQIKVVGHFPKNAPSYFEAYLPSGDVISYGDTSGTQPVASNGAARAWLASGKRDPRGNAITYGYCFVTNEEDDSIVEYALDEIRDGTRVVSFLYGSKDADDVRTVHSNGMEFRQSLRLDEVQLSIGDELVRRYGFEYDRSETTGRTRLVAVDECGAEGSCLPPTRFLYLHVQTGFEKVHTQIAAPMSRKASPVIADFTGDGLPDWLIPDTNAQSTATNPITEWRLSRNAGSAFAAPNVAYWQTWSFQQEPMEPSNPETLQPELGTPIDYDQDGLKDVLLHDVYNNRNHLVVLRSRKDGTFEEIETGIKKPFSAGPTPKGLRSSAASVHLADVTGDGVSDLILCTDHGHTPMSTWKLHHWRPGGFEPQGTMIQTLSGIGCNVEMHTMDENRDGISDLIVPGVTRGG